MSQGCDMTHEPLDSMSALIYVTSPFQAISAYEAIQHFGVKSYFLIVQIEQTTTSKNRGQLEKTLEWLNLKVDCFLNRDSRSRFFEQIKILRAFKSSHLDYLFVGETSSFTRALCANISAKTNFLLDDGLAIYKQYIEQTSPLPARKKAYWFYRDSRFFFFGFKLKTNRQIKFFTALLPTQIPLTERVVRHEFNFLKVLASRDRTQLCSGALSDDLVFVGTGYEDLLGGDDLHNFYRKLHEIVLDFSKKSGRCLYFLHRSQKISDLSDCIAEFDLVELTMPIEIEFLLSGARPSVIIGTVSTALLTLKCLLPRTRIVAIDVRGLGLSHSELDEAYFLLERGGVELYTRSSFELS